ncbi:unnamed protein product [Strongylus vulgaris]|uniref:PID domain-containing protein n=1 Tax=Strongylus vulgaris TaxID=40348 RepID=A0A3P7L2R0_STRVU|nr:unnamed protein product [Strongylus vulgaris]
MTPDLRQLVVKECINMIAGELKIIPEQEMNPIIKKIVGSPQVANYKVDLSISTKALNIIYTDPKDKERMNRLIARHSIELVSFAAQGSEVRQCSINHYPS